MVKRHITAGIFVAAWSLWAAPPVTAQVNTDASAREQTGERVREPGVRLDFNKRPSLRIGRWLRSDFRVKSQADWRDLSSTSDRRDEDAFDVPRLRVGLEGTFLRKLEYQVEREMRDPDDPWRDLFVNLRVLRAAQIQAGHFKLPFSLDQTTGNMDLDFTYRSLAASYLAPGRDVGVMAHGTLGNGVKYEAGVFRRGGKTPLVAKNGSAASPRTIAGRLVLRPWAPTSMTPLRALTLGLALTAGRVPEGLNGLRGRTVAEDVFFERVYVSGLRRRVGVEMQWRMGPVSAQGEVIRVRDERRGQGVDDESLPDMVSRGWYFSGTWLVTGERKKGSIEPTRPFLKRGIGALELAGRVETLSFGSSVSGGEPSQGPRAPYLSEKSDRALTAGVNWYLNEFLKVQAGVVRELRRDDGRVLERQGRLWSRTLRVQFAL